MRTDISNILEDLAVELAATAVIAIAAAFITFGAGAAVSTAKAAHTLSKFAKIVPLHGRFETVITVSGEQVTVRGFVDNGLIKIGTAFIP